MRGSDAKGCALSRIRRILMIQVIDDKILWTNGRGDVLFWGSREAWERLAVSANVMAREITERIDAEVMSHFAMDKLEAGLLKCRRPE